MRLIDADALIGAWVSEKNHFVTELGRMYDMAMDDAIEVANKVASEVSVERMIVDYCRSNDCCIDCEIRGLCQKFKVEPCFW